MGSPSSTCCVVVTFVCHILVTSSSYGLGMFGQGKSWKGTWGHYEGETRVFIPLVSSLLDHGLSLVVYSAPRPHILHSFDSCFSVPWPLGILIAFRVFLKITWSKYFTWLRLCNCPLITSSLIIPLGYTTCFQRKPGQRAGELAQPLRKCTALTGDPCFSPSIHVRHVITACNSSSWRLMPSSGLYRHLRSCAHTRMHTHNYK